MAKLLNSRNLYNQIKLEIYDKFQGDMFMLEMVLSDYICVKIFAEYDLNLNNVIKDFLLQRGFEPKDKEIGRLKPSEVKKELRKRFGIQNDKLVFLDNREDFTDFVLNRHRIGHTVQCSSISFERALKMIDEADEILENVRNVIRAYGKTGLPLEKRRLREWFKFSWFGKLFF